MDLHDLDIGLAPFPDTGWTPWRCHGKVLQYMAIGIPTVASRIGILPEYIRDGEEGFLAGSDNDWIEKLGLLLHDAALRKRLGDQGRRRIQERDAAAVWAPRVRAIFEDVVAGAGGTRHDADPTTESSLKKQRKRGGMLSRPLLKLGGSQGRKGRESMAHW